MEIVIIIIIGALAWRGAMSLADATDSKIAMVYAVAAIPVALLNGFLINGWLGLFIVGGGTWIGMLVANLLFRFNPMLQFFLFGSANLAWTIYNIFQVF